jgi:hypothetical protein
MLMAIEIQITKDGICETVDITAVEMTADLAAAIAARLGGLCRKAGRPFVWRLGWALAFHSEADAEVRRTLLAALRFAEPGLAGVVFQDRGREVVARFVRTDGKELAERFALPESPAAPIPVPVPAAPVLSAPIAVPVASVPVASVPVASVPVASVPVPPRGRAAAVPPESSPPQSPRKSGRATLGLSKAGDLSKAPKAPEQAAAPTPAASAATADAAKAETATAETAVDTARSKAKAKADVKLDADGFVVWWK